MNFTAKSKFPRVSAPFAVALTVGLLGSAAAYAQVQTAEAPEPAQTAPAAQPAETAEAPEPAKSSYEEIVVTATRRKETAATVPVSIEALSSAEMDEKHIKDITDVVRFTPGLTVDVGQTNAVTIRGIAATGGAATTGIYIDDVPIQMRAQTSSADNPLVKVFDLNRVEVLRGPQGTLFGAGSEGGTVRYITNQPSLEKYSGYAHTEVATTEGGGPSYEAGAAVGGPVVKDVLGLRMSAWFRRDGGWIDQVDPLSLQKTNNDSNSNNTVALRAAALWAPTDWLVVEPSIDYQRSDLRAKDLYWPIYSNPGNNKYVSADPSSVPEPDKFFLPSLNIQADLGDFEFISTTSYFDRKNTANYDGTVRVLSLFQQYGIFPQYFPLIDQNGLHIPAVLGNNYGQDTTTIQNNQRNVTQEFRLQSTDADARLSWTAGAFFSVDTQYSQERDDEPGVDPLFVTLFGANYGTVFGTPLNADGSTYLADGKYSFTDFAKTVDKQFAGFGEAKFKILDGLSITGGLRVAYVHVGLHEQTGGAIPGYIVTSDSTQKEVPVTPKVNLSYQMDENHLFYTTYSKGFRPGGGNASIPYQFCALDFANFGIPGAPTSYKSDQVESYEIGAKDAFFDHRVRLASSAYYIKWNAIQQAVIPPICGSEWTQNMGAAVSKGFDLQADVDVTDALSLSLATGYNDAYFTQDAFVGTSTTALPVVRKGDGITGANGLVIAPWTVSAGAQYKFELASFPAFIRFDYQFSAGQGDRKPAALDPGTLQYGLGVAQFYEPLHAHQFASLRYGMDFGKWSAAAFVDNLFDTNTTINELNTAATVDSSTGTVLAAPLSRRITYRPRTIGFALTYKY